MYGYIYETTNLINNKKYIGKRTSKKFLPNYLGSGVLITKAIEKYGKENFTVKLIEEVNGDKNILNEREQYWINFYNAVDNDEFYNLSKGGDGGFHSLETNKKISKTLTGVTFEERFGVEKANEIKNKISNGNLGRHHSEEAKMKISESKKGEKNPMYGLTGELSPSYGRKLSKETKNKISNSLTGRKLSKEVILKRSATVKGSKRTDEQKQRMKEAQNRPEVKEKRSKSLKGIPRTEEWKRKISESTKGRLVSEESKLLISKAIKGKIKVNDGKNNKYIYPNELDAYLKNNWKRGFIKREKI